MELKICHLYPELLNQSGDAGNVSCLQRRLEDRGIDVHITKLHAGEQLSLKNFDIVFIGGGQELGQEVLIADLMRGRAEDIRAAVEEGVVFLAIDFGFELMGKYRESAEGARTELVGAVDMYTKEAKQRFTGNYMFSCHEGGTVVAFENHSGRTYLGEGLEPLGTVISGHGNNGADGGEGIRYKNLFGSYGHGPLLPKNPQLADLILKTALKRKYGYAELGSLDDYMEHMAHEDICKRLGGGK